MVRGGGGDKLLIAKLPGLDNDPAHRAGGASRAVDRRGCAG